MICPTGSRRDREIENILYRHLARPHPLVRHSRYRARTSPEPPPPVADEASSRRERFGRSVSFIPEIDPVQRLGATPEQSVIR